MNPGQVMMPITRRKANISMIVVSVLMIIPRDRGALRTIVYLFLCEYRVFLVSKENGKMFQEKDCLFSDHGGYPGTCKGREIDLAPAVVGIMVVSIGQKLIDLPSGIGHSEHGFRSKTL